MKNNRVAVLIDGSFFLKRYYSIINRKRDHLPEEVAKYLYTMAHLHVGKENHLYRIFYYDCVPSDKRVHHPLNNKCINFAKTDQYKFRMQLFEELKKKRKVALRLGYLRDNKKWVINPRNTKDLINGNKLISDLKEEDFTYEFRQKGIDIKIGVDIASISYKRFVDRIVLIAGDADFVPAAKLARREGIDFILDPMWNPIDDFLFEHIDGLKSTCRTNNKN